MDVDQQEKYGPVGAGAQALPILLCPFDRHPLSRSGHHNRATDHAYQNPRPARHEAPLCRRSRRDRAPRLPVRGAQPDPPAAGPPSGAASAQLVRQGHTACCSEEQVYRVRQGPRDNQRVWAVPGASAARCFVGARVSNIIFAVPIQAESVQGRVAWRASGQLVEQRAW